VADEKYGDFTAILGLQGKKALINGGGQGIGRSSALLLATAGADVAIVDNVPELGQAVVEEIKGLGRKSALLDINLLDDSQMTRLVPAVVQELGGLDVVINVVGRPLWRATHEMTLDEWDGQFRLNLDYIFRSSQEAFRYWRDRGRGGSIVSISSGSGTEASPGHAAYGAAKAALIQLTQTLGVEWAAQGVRVNAIAPGSIRTPRSVSRTPAEMEAKIIEKVPMGRRGESDDIGKVVLFLASEMSSYVTGQTIIVDGGAMIENWFPVRYSS
jgi:NAD(P)-dependent dehydrogenase (short-subunit alcohol dehydrogenase family)